MWLGEQLLGYGCAVTPHDIKDRLRAVRPSDVRKVACDFFRPNRLNLALVTPLKRNPGLTPLLARLAS